MQGLLKNFAALQNNVEDSAFLVFTLIDKAYFCGNADVATSGMPKPVRL